ncbi:MAG: hypothetical protein Q8M65_10790 [Rhodoglobus sp.]|nr:hypothetical protein [Rhodoglobus sp.]
MSDSVTIDFFAKKDENDGTCFFQLGSARATSPFQASMTGKNNVPIPVVRVTLRFDDAFPQGLLDYFQPTITE